MFWSPGQLGSGSWRLNLGGLCQCGGACAASPVQPRYSGGGPWDCRQGKEMMDARSSASSILRPLTCINLMLLSVMNALHLLFNQVIHNDGRNPLLRWREMPMPESQHVKPVECDGCLSHRFHVCSCAHADASNNRKKTPRYCIRRLKQINSPTMPIVQILAGGRCRMATV